VRAALGATAAALRRSLLAESMVLAERVYWRHCSLAWPMVAVLGKYAARFSVRRMDWTLDSNLVVVGIASRWRRPCFWRTSAAAFGGYVARTGLNNGSQGRLRGATAGCGIFAITTDHGVRFCLLPGWVLMRTLFTLEEERPPSIQRRCWR